MTDSFSSDVAPLYAELVSALGLEAALPDEDGQLSLAINDALVVSLGYRADDDAVVLFSYLGAVPEFERASTLQRILEGNFAWHETAGATLGIEAACAAVTLMKALPRALLTGAALVREVSAFAEVAIRWSGALAQLADMSQTAQAAPQALPEVPVPGLSITAGGWLRP